MSKSKIRTISALTLVAGIVLSSNIAVGAANPVEKAIPSALHLQVQPSK
jgi:hypothetical protein